MNRRGFLTGLTSLVVAAPAIVRVSSLMPLSGFVMPAITLDEYAGNQLLTIDMITRQAIKLFCNSNGFLREREEDFSGYAPIRLRIAA